MMKDFRWPGTGGLVVLVCAVIAVAGCAAQLPEAPAGIGQQIANASSRSDHDDVAAQYERQAAADGAAAKRHNGYASTYRKNTSPRSGVSAHEGLARH